MRTDRGDAETEALAPHVLRLEGCRPTPLASYLKALGVFRLVSEQCDPTARGWWHRDVFHLESSLDAAALRAFLLEKYRPTPVLGPWNGGSGFYDRDTKGIKALVAITEGSAARFDELRETIRTVQRVLDEQDIDERPSDKDKKAEMVTSLRNSAREPFLRWIDAALALGTEELLYPPLLGTGGNDGRLDFTVNFVENLAAVIDPEDGGPAAGGSELLEDALFGVPVPGLPDSAIGQFAPGSAGGPNAASGFSGGSQINPWDFVLLIEGAILFATGTVRRLGAEGRGILAYPFTVRPTGAGAGGAAPSDAGTARAETWVPLWNGAAQLNEVERLLSEGRLVLAGRPARDGLDVARAVAKLGTDRGVDSLQRYVFFQRSGNAYLAAPMGRIRVQRKPEADLIDDLDKADWLDRFRRTARDQHAPARLTTLLHKLEDALFDLARRDDPGPAVYRTLVTLGECQQYFTTSPDARHKCGPVPILRPEWAKAADDGSAAFSLAVGLAGLHGVRDVGQEGARGGHITLTMAEYLAPVSAYTGNRRPAWYEGDVGRRRAVWGVGPVHGRLGRVMRRRLLDSRAEDLHELPMRGTGAAPLAAVVEWLRRPDWDGAVSDLVQGLSLVRWPSVRRPTQDPRRIAFPATYALLKPCFTPASQMSRVLKRLAQGTDELTHGDEHLPAPDELVRLLTAGRVQDAVDAAHRILRVRGYRVSTKPPVAGRTDGRRLLSALMVPLSDWDLSTLIRTQLQRGSKRAATISPNQED